MVDVFTVTAGRCHDRRVEIGEQWSPQTAPARQDAMEITIICPSGNTPITIGIRMLNVPQDVPVANARNAATRK